MRRFVFYLIFCLSFVSFGQENYKVKFGEEEKTDKKIRVQFLGIQGDYLYYYKTKIKFGTFGEFILQVDKNTLDIKQEFELEFEDGEMNQISFINDRIVVFMEDSDRKSGKTRLFFHTINPNSMKWDKLNVEVANFERKTGLFSSAGSFQIYETESKEKFAIWYDLPYDKNEPEKFGLAIFDGELKKIKEKVFQLKESDKDILIGRKYLSESGDFYFAAKQVTDRTAFGNTKAFKNLFYLVGDGEELTQFEFELPERKIVEYTFMVDGSGRLICSGLFGLEDRDNIKGAFYARINPKNGALEKTSYQDFSDEFITDGWSDREVSKAEKKKEKGKEPVLRNYDIRSIITMEDNSSILVAEQYYVVVHTYVDAQGNSRTTYTYYYNSIIVIRINPEGELVWTKKIPKNQVSTNDSGYYSSFSYHVGKKGIYFMFNDNIKNYEDGDANGGTTYKTTFGKKGNVVSMVKMNYETGDFDKQQLFTRMDIGMLTVPKAHFSAKDQDKLYFYARAKKLEKIGVVSF